MVKAAHIFPIADTIDAYAANDTAFAELAKRGAVIVTTEETLRDTA